MADQDPLTAAHLTALDRICEALDDKHLMQRLEKAIALANQVQIPTSNAAVTIGSGGASILAFVVGLIGVLAIVVAVACVYVQKADHRADMQELHLLQVQVTKLQADADLERAYRDSQRARDKK